MIMRNLSPSRFKKLISLTTYTYTNTRPVSNFLHSLIAVRSYSSQNRTKTLLSVFSTKPFPSQPVKNQSLSRVLLTRDGNYDEANEQSFPICPGCGVHMQDFDRKQPGFFIKPSNRGRSYKKFKKVTTPITDESEISDSPKRGVMNEIVEVLKQNEIIDGERPENLETEGQVFDKMSKKVENLRSPDEEEASEKPIFCFRCHHLNHHGKVAPHLLPAFDFDHTVGKKLMSVSGSRTVILLVVDATDFDGSFSKKVANLISKTVDENAESSKEGNSGNIPRLLLVVTKIDLLPSNITPVKLEQWVRTRAREAGAGKLTRVHLVSATRDLGVKELVGDVVKFAGERGNVWAVGARNAGKSALINAIGKFVGVKETHLTESPVPCTTLGIVRVEGLLPGKAKLFDTPGILHRYQMWTMLTRKERNLIRIDKELKPRTYRIQAGHSVHIGGLLRLDIEESSVDSIYVTVWASPLLPLHMGKTENACTMLKEHIGHQLQPPIGKDRVEQLGKWVKNEFLVTGNSGDSSAVDIAAAGLGWFAIGLEGEALLGVWTYDGVEVILRDALLPQISHNFQVAGFSVSEIVSKADQARHIKPKLKKKSKCSNNSTKVSSSASSTLTIDADSESNNSITASILSCFKKLYSNFSAFKK